MLHIGKLVWSIFFIGIDMTCPSNDFWFLSGIALIVLAFGIKNWMEK